MRLFVGLDVLLEKIVICVISEYGKIVKEVQVVSEFEVLLCWICDQDGVVVVVGFEVGFLLQWLYCGLLDVELFVVLMEIRQVKGVLKVMLIKIDRWDVEGIVCLFYLGWFWLVYCKLVFVQEVWVVFGVCKVV